MSSLRVNVRWLLALPLSQLSQQAAQTLRLRLPTRICPYLLASGLEPLACRHCVVAAFDKINNVDADVLQELLALGNAWWDRICSKSNVCAQLITLVLYDLEPAHALIVHVHGVDAGFVESLAVRLVLQAEAGERDGEVLVGHGMWKVRQTAVDRPVSNQSRIDRSFS